MSDKLASLIADVREQVLYMQELGADTLEVDLARIEFPKSKVVESPKPREVPMATPIVQNTAQRPATTRESRLSALPSLANRPSKETPITAAPPMPATKKAEDPVLIEVASRLEESPDTIESIRADIGSCTRCKLHSLGRKQIVHTTGNFQTDLMFVGEAPGADEDEQGFPFVGRAGQLLTKIIESIGMRREDVCIGNINRCRPPGNRQPEPDETAMCRPFILREIAVVKPKVIVVLGATAAHNLLQVKTPISRLRGNFQDYFGVKVMPTFHPAYLLRDPHKKREVWDDMKKVRDYLAENK